MLERLASIYRCRALVQILIVRDLKARYRGTFLGLLWSFINPLLLMSIYSLVFSVYMRIDMEHYATFLLTGLLPWNFFAAALNEGTQSIVGNNSLIKKLYLPSEIFPLVSICSNAIHYLLSIPILLLFLAFGGASIKWSVLLFPLILLIQVVFMYGLTLFTSALAVWFRDLFHIIPNLLIVILFLTPIFYPPHMVPGKLSFLLALNPMSHIVQFYQTIFYYGRCPDLTALAVSAVVACVIATLGMRYFISRKDNFAEEI